MCLIWPGEGKTKRIAETRKQGGTRKIADAPPPPCRDPEHEPPKMMVFEPGTYEHICPTCGKKTIFTVSAAYL